MVCEYCNVAKAVILRSKSRKKVCKECFYEQFENEIHQLVVESAMFEKNSRVGIGISGGKDSTVLAYVLNKLNIKYNYGLDLVLLCVDEGISGYRDKSIETVLENQKILNMKLETVSYKEMFGMTMDEVVQKTGRKGNCTYCGVFRRQALEEAARRLKVDCIVTGHNADDMAETVLLNFYRGDISRLKRCALSKTKEHISDENTKKHLSLARCKPFKYTYQREIVFYAYFKKLPYFTTECTYASGASRGDFRELVKDLERIDPTIIINIIKSGEMFLEDTPTNLIIKKCLRCKNPTSSADQICNACSMVEKLSRIVKECCKE
ncbi:TIGR00269 family protein [Vittaforma corneae ATCC 50505]|uniref:Cytoplasmic tRNA 2-thiolation protein 1 n=1 Tax=Vittaforma corneae (strain ATCC 50505) TaxID=993615 RepID=L2GNI7_VITCO|nr:TIGR00269 family protein [Vittaforma corneae ATCC 50505]ELA42458.1 TIGR00269 family protein [Vittaforma corneae ATCC 50505]